MTPDNTKARELVRETAERLSIEGQIKSPALSEEARLRSKMDACARDLFQATRILSTLPQSIEPSEAMIEAGYSELLTWLPFQSTDEHRGAVAGIYRAMCSAQGEGNE